MTKRVSGREKFVTFVNRNIGKNLTTGIISRRSGLNVRVVQEYCKSVRENNRSVKYSSSTRGGGSINYIFSKPIGVQDIRS